MALSSSKNTHNNTTKKTFPSSKQALLIFTRNPELGKVKTRLAKSVGDESALKIYTFLVQHTVHISENLKVDKYVFYSEKIQDNDFWDPAIFTKKLQDGKDLGERMQQAFSEIFEMGYENAIIIGSDMYNLEKKDLENAFAMLQNTQFTIGPATDGGYYLLGMKRLKKELFQNKNWGTSTVLENTLNDLKDEKYTLLKERNDIDYYGDIKNEAIFQQFLPPYLDTNFL